MVDDPDNDAIQTVGWRAIDAALRPMYGDHEPRHYGTLISYALGGPDPIDGVSAYWRDAPTPHWHYVTYGFSELYDKQTDDPDVSGYGFELTFRLAADARTPEPPIWPMNLLQNLARYVFSTGNAFAAGDHMNARGPIHADDASTRLTSLGFARDPELPPADTPHGRVEFLQVVGITDDEERAMRAWDGEKLLDLASRHLPLLVTDLARPSLTDDAAFAAQTRAGADRDGSTTSTLNVTALSWSTTRPLLGKLRATITLGALAVPDLCEVLVGRLGHGRPLLLSGDDAIIAFKPAEEGEAGNWRVESEAGKQWPVVTLTPAGAAELARSLRPSAGRHDVAGAAGLTLVVEPTVVRDRNGNSVRTIG